MFKILNQHEEDFKGTFVVQHAPLSLSLLTMRQLQCSNDLNIKPAIRSQINILYAYLSTWLYWVYFCVVAIAINVITAGLYC